LASKDHCYISNGVVYPITTLRKKWFEIKNKNSSITSPHIFVPNVLTDVGFAGLAWDKIFNYIGLALNYTKIMIPISKPLIGDYQLLDLEKFLTPYTDGTRFKLRTIEESYQKRSIFQKKIMRNYNHVILVNYDVKTIKDSRTWRALQYRILDRYAGNTGDFKKRYEFIRDILLNPTIYNQMVRSVWNGGIIKNSIDKNKVPKYIASFSCLATRINQIIDSM